MACARACAGHGVVVPTRYIASLGGRHCADCGLRRLWPRLAIRAECPRPDPALPRPRQLPHVKAGSNLGTDFWKHRVELAAEAASVSRARMFVRARLREHGLAEIEGDVILVVSELATNALSHARTPFTVTVRREDRALVLTVRDGSPLHPAVVGIEVMAGGGRGILIVDALSHDWGSVDQPGAAKYVWASFALPAAI